MLGYAFLEEVVQLGHYHGGTHLLYALRLAISSKGRLGYPQAIRTVLDPLAPSHTELEGDSDDV